MESMYQLPPLFAYPPMQPEYFPAIETPEQAQFLGYLSQSDPQPYLLGNPLLDPRLLEERFQPDYSSLGRLGSNGLMGTAFGSLDLNPSARQNLPPLLGMNMNAPAQDFMAPYRANPRKPLVDESLNCPRPYRPSKPTKDVHLAHQHDPQNWKLRSGHLEDSQNIAPDRNNVRKTIYITDVDHQITEEQLAVFFKSCGDVLDCRVCGDPNSAMRFAFVEFATEQAASQALHLNGTVLGDYPLRVLPSKTAIVPVNTQYLPKTTTEREKCSRTVYAANIDKKVDRESVKLFFETICGPVGKIRLLGDWQHSTRIAFVEFINAESAKLALGCSGALLGSLPIRVSPSKTPVRDDPISSSERPSVYAQPKWG